MRKGLRHYPAHPSTQRVSACVGWAMGEVAIDRIRVTAEFDIPNKGYSEMM